MKIFLKIYTVLKKGLSCEIFELEKMFLRTELSIEKTLTIYLLKNYLDNFALNLFIEPGAVVTYSVEIIE